MKTTLLLAAVATMLLGANVQEPSTKVSFPDTLDLPQGKVTLTGVDVRVKFFMNIYAIGHYGSGEMPKATDAKELLTYWAGANVLKAFDLKFVYTVSAKRIRGAWEEGLDNAGYHGPSREGLLAAFQTEIKKGDDLLFIGQPDGTLVAQLNGTKLGEWKDPELVKAMWQIWMGKKSPLTDKDNLVRIKS